MRKRRSPRPLVFADALAAQIQSGQKVSPQKAAVTAGYDLATAGDVGAHLIRQRAVQSRVLASLERAGITQETLAQTASQGLQANETKLVTYEGKVTERVDMPDHHARFKYWESLNRIFGNFPKEETVQQAALIVKLPVEASAEETELALARYFESRQVTPELPPKT